MTDPTHPAQCVLCHERPEVSTLKTCCPTVREFSTLKSGLGGYADQGRHAGRQTSYQATAQDWCWSSEVCQ